MAIDPSNRHGPGVGEQNSYVPIVNDTLIPALSVLRVTPIESLGPTGTTLIGSSTSLGVYPKYAQLVHLINPGDISISLSAGDLIVYVDELEELIDRSNVLLESLTGHATNHTVLLTNINTGIITLTGSNAANGIILNNIDTRLITLTGLSNDIYSSVSSIDIKTNLVNSRLSALTSINTSINAKLAALTANYLSPVVMIDDQGINTTSTPVDILGYSYATVQVSLTGSATISVQTSNDGYRWFTEIAATTDSMIALEGAAAYCRTVLSISSGGSAGAAIITAVR